MTELRQRMLDAMVQRGFALRTQETYIRAIRRMAKHYRRDPAQYTQHGVGLAPFPRTHLGFLGSMAWYA